MAQLQGLLGPEGGQEPQLGQDKATDETPNHDPENGQFSSSGGSSSSKNEEGKSKSSKDKKLVLQIPKEAKHVVELKGNEIAGANLEERVASAWNFWGEHFAGKEAEREDIKKIKFFNSSAREILGNDVNEGKLDLFPALFDIVQNGKLVDEKELDEPKPNGIKKFYYIQAKVMVDGKPRYAQVDIGERKDGKRLYYLNEIMS